jgi:hypothetical protein
LRAKSRAIACLIVLLGIAWAWERPAAARAAQELLPEESAAKAKQVLQQVIAALGGPAYLNVHDSECIGKIAQYGLVGDLPDYTDFRELWLLPDKNRTEYSIKSDQTIAGFLLGSDGLWFAPGGTTVTVFTGSEGWILGKKGLENQPDDVVKNFNEQLESSMNHVLRSRLNEPGLEARFAGPDIIDLKEADWIELTDHNHRNLRLGVERSTHLPLRWVVATRDPESRRTIDVTTTYVQYMTMDGVKTPLNIEMYRNGRRINQTYLSSCKYNTDPSPQLFTRVGLEQRASDSNKKGRKDSKSGK